MDGPTAPACQLRQPANCASLFGIARIPGDNHIRDMLDPAEPALLRPVFAQAVGQLGRIDSGPDGFRRIGGRVLIALDGTKYYCSRSIRCPHCPTRLCGESETEYHHAMLAATLVAPRHDKVIPPEPEFPAGTGIPRRNRNSPPEPEFPAGTGIPRRNRNSSSRRTGRRSRTARTRPPGAGSPPMPGATQPSTRFIPATTCSPASRCVRRCRRRAGWEQRERLLQANTALRGTPGLTDWVLSNPLAAKLATDDLAAQPGVGPWITRQVNRLIGRVVALWDAQGGESAAGNRQP